MEILEALEVCAEELEEIIGEKYPEDLCNRSKRTKRHFLSDMEAVRDARRAMAKLENQMGFKPKRLGWAKHLVAKVR